MDLRTALRTRRSIRAFRPEPVPDDALRSILELAHWAPSAGNLQARDFLVIREASTKEALVRLAHDQTFLAQAPVVIVVCANARRIEEYGRRGRDLYMVQDAAAATENLLLAVHDAGLGAVWVGAFDEEAVRRLLGLPVHVRPLALIPIGVPAESPAPPDRLPEDEVVHWERW